MRNHKINFFESPNPRHFNLQNLPQCKYHHSEDPQNNEDLLFVTPVRLNTNFLVSPTPQVAHHLSCPQVKPKRTFEEEISDFYSQSLQRAEEQELSDQQIKEKIVFSDEQEQEELLLPITPLKIQQKKQQNIEPTMRRQPNAHIPSTPLTPASEGRPIQRGLKKLAAEAYRFVVRQKRTSYKQVARKLLSQLEDERDINNSAKGQMNIKRRVYDALNVLIALGILKRNGHKLIIKRQELQFTEEDVMLGRESQRRRELAMQEERNNLRQTCLRREKLITQKRKMQERIKQKISSLKELLDKNKSLKEQSINLETQQKQQVSRIDFPIFVLGHNQFHQVKSSQQKDVKNASTEHKGQEQLKLWQENPGVLNVSFDKQKNIQLLGEIDLLALWKNEDKRNKTKKVHRKLKFR